MNRWRRSRPQTRYARILPCLVLACSFLGFGCAKPEGSPKALLTSGWDNYRLAEDKQAIQAFERLIEITPEDHELHLHGLYGLATTWNLRLPVTSQKKELATELYNKIIAQAPEHDLAAWSLLALARMKHLVGTGVEPDYPAVRQAYQEVIDRFPGHYAAQEALIYQQATLVATLDPDDARKAEKALLGLIETYPDSGFVSPALSLLSVVYTTLDMQEKRLWAEIESFKRIEVDPENPDQDHSWRYWNIATIAEFEVGDFDTAREYYGKLVQAFPTDARMYAAEQALKRMDRIEEEFRQGRRNVSGASKGGPSS